jgi:hypothetical protein
MDDSLETFCDDLSRAVPDGGTAKAKRFDNADGEFWPDQSLNDLITAEIVHQVFNEANPAYDPTLVAFVVDKAKKLFAITANIDSRPQLLLARMQFFKSTGFTDDSLAAEMETSDSSGHASIDNNSIPFADRLASRDPTGKLWRPAAREKFSHNLWKAVSPVFSASEANYNFKTSTILPFSELNANVKGGAFSTVHKVAIYEGYYKDAAVPVSGILLASHIVKDDAKTRARLEN